MRNPRPRRARPSVPFLTALFACAAPALAQGLPTDFATQFALATDRKAVLDQLVPGTEDYYYYHCLHSQQTGAFDEVAPTLSQWIERHGRSPRVAEIENREALLTYGRDPRATYAFLRQRLGIDYGAQRAITGARTDLPTRLDPALLSLPMLQQRALQWHQGSVDGFTDAGLPSLLTAGVPDDLLRPLLQRLSRPDLPGLAALVARELAQPRSQGFGALPIHGLLLQSQLDELALAIPALLNDPRYVEVYLPRLWPAHGVDLARDAAQRERFLDRLQAFADRLPASQNAFKAHVLWHRLAHDLQRGQVDRQRLLAYLRLPKRANYISPEWLRRSRGADIAALGASFPTGLQAVADDEPLVRQCLQQLFLKDDDYQPYAEFVRKDWLERLFAETRILAGTGDMERWYSLLNDPGYYEQLQKRVDLEFTADQRERFAAGDAVSLDLWVKNVDTLLVKVFRIDAWAHARDTGVEVDATIDLDGLVANDEQVHRYTEPPLRRVRRRFDFPKLLGEGTWVVEFVGNGVSSRAVVQKGWLSGVSRKGAAGHVITVFDEAGQQVMDAVAFVAGREIAADQRGEIVVPFSAQPASRPLVLRRGAAVSVQPFAHEGEDYALEAAVFVDRESLRRGERATMLVRPRLSVDGVPIDLSLLQDTVLDLVAQNRDGVASTQTVRAPKWNAAGEYVHEFTVPPDLQTLTVAVRGRVDNMSRGQPVELAATPSTFTCNAIDRTAVVAAPMLGRDQDGWFLDLRGRNGEPIAGRAVDLVLRHRAFTDPITATLATDAAGRIGLGTLDGIRSLGIAGGDAMRGWGLDERTTVLPALVTGTAGETLRVPYAGRAQRLDRGVATLVERRGPGDGVPARELSQQLALQNGFVELRNLEPGDYDLCLDGERHVAIVVVDGAARAGWAVGRSFAMPLVGRNLLAIESVAADAAEVTVRLRNAGPEARVHAFATRYLPAWSPLDQLTLPAAAVPATVDLGGSECVLAAGRMLGDELRYVLERRYATKYPGNMLMRPSLLLNPWSPEQAAVTSGTGGGAGGRYGGRGGRPGAAKAEGKGDFRGEGESDAGVWANLDWLPGAVRLAANLRPDADGIVRIKLADLGAGQMIQVVAVDGDDVASRSLALPSQPLRPRDLSLQDALDAGKHFAEKRELQFVAPGGEAVIDDLAAANVQTFATLADVHALLMSVRADADLAKFAFVLRWPQLTDDEKREFYREHACHELHFFIHGKDRAFFDRVLRPYLANKAHKEFLDHWLLDDDLAGWLEPWRFAQLNLVERILLLQKVGGDDSLARYVRELGELIPVDPLAAWTGSDAFFLGRALDEKAKELTAQAERFGDRANAPAAPPPAAAAPDPSRQPADEPAELEARDKDADRGLLSDYEARKAGADDLLRRRDQRQLYREPDPTRRYLESDYWHRLRTDERADSIAANGFWRDFAAAPGGKPFFSSHLNEVAGSFTEAMFALAVLDLPFTAEAPLVERTGNRAVLRPKTPLLLARAEMAPAEIAEGTEPVLIRQDCYRLDDRYAFVGAERRPKYVRGEFLSGVGYGCQVVVTNPTESPRRVDVLLQIPRGALPLAGSHATRTVPMQLQPFATATLEYSFYFPADGDFAHFPAHASIAGAFSAAAEAGRYHVVATPTVADVASWDHVSQDGAADAVFAFLERSNLARVEFGRIAWRLRERAFFDRMTAALRARHFYDDGVWSWSLLHEDEATAREYLAQQTGFVQQCGKALASPLLAIDPVERRAYEHVELEPLYLARAHRVGAWQKVQNQDLDRQWQSFVGILGCRDRLDADDLASATYYLLLQGRTEAALQAFARIDPKAIATKLQFDYLAAYLAFFRAAPQEAIAIAERHRDHPVARWRKLFGDVLQQASEAAGGPVAKGDPLDRGSQQTALAGSEPQLDVQAGGDGIAIRHRNVDRVELRYHLLDVEFAFSANPFSQQGQGAVAWVEPHSTAVVDLGKDQDLTTVPLPAEYRRGNVVVEVRGGGLVRRATSLASALEVQTVESYGQLQVRSTQNGALMPKVYVKVFARLPGGGVRFHKDGYTDLRGRFDYASVSEGGSAGAERYALLVLSENDGAVIREVAPPLR